MFVKRFQIIPEVDAVSAKARDGVEASRYQGPTTFLRSVTPGATLATSAADCINAASDLVVICLLSNTTVYGNLVSPGALDALAGKTVANLTNGTPAHARELSNLVTEHGGHYIHGGVIAMPNMIGHRGAVLLYSGSEPRSDAWKPTSLIWELPNIFPLLTRVPPPYTTWPYLRECAATSPVSCMRRPWSVPPAPT